MLHQRIRCPIYDIATFTTKAGSIALREDLPIGATETVPPPNSETDFGGQRFRFRM